MKNGDIQKFVQLTREAQKYLNEISGPTFTRKRKTTIADGVAFKLYYSKKDSSQDKATIKLNNFMNRNTFKSKVRRQSYVEREDGIDISTYKGLYELIDKFSNTHFYNNRVIQVFSADGTQVNLSINLVKDGLTPTKNEEIVNGLIMGIYNVTYNYPVSMELVNDKDERGACIDFLKNTDKYKGCIFIFDRGFMDHKLFKFLDDKKINYICRIRENSIIIPENSNDEEVIDKHNNKMRIITYTIDKNDYYLATNLFDKKEYTISQLKDLYHKRWRIDEHFKYMKTNTNLNNMLEKDKTSIMKTIYAQLIVSRIVDLLSLIKGPHEKENMIINKTALTDAVYNDFLLKFIYNKHINRRTVREFLTISAEYTHTQKGEYYERKSRKPYTKWYIKKFYKKYITIDANKERIKELQKKNYNKKKEENQLKV